jgi:YbbR domain-containing protein
MKKLKNVRIEIIVLFIAIFLFIGCSAEQLPCERVVQPGFVLVE